MRAKIFDIILTIIIAAMVAFVTVQVERCHERPKINVTGVMPIHLYGPIENAPKEVQEKFRVHKLAFIFKVENTSPTEAVVHTAVLEGCVPIDSIVADMHLPEENRMPSGTNIEEWSERYEHAIQRISATGFVRQDTQVVTGDGTAYVGVLFPLTIQGAYGTVHGSISLQGRCKEIRVANPQPAIQQIFDFDMKPIHSSIPRGLRPEFENGRLEVTLLVGSDRIRIDPHRIGRIYSIVSKNWLNLALPQMYENPDTKYPPLIKNRNRGNTDI